jgi:hypothetical protein
MYVYTNLNVYMNEWMNECIYIYTYIRHSTAVAAMDTSKLWICLIPSTAGSFLYSKALTKQVGFSFLLDPIIARKNIHNNLCKKQNYLFYIIILTIYLMKSNIFFSQLFLIHLFIRFLLQFHLPKQGLKCWMRL